MNATAWLEGAAVQDLPEHGGGDGLHALHFPLAVARRLAARDPEVLPEERRGAWDGAGREGANQFILPIQFTRWGIPLR